MGSRRRARVFALQALYEADVRELSASAAMNALWSGVMDGDGFDPAERPPESDEVEFAQQVVRGVDGHKDEIDSIIAECSTNWRIQRMPVVDRNILRMAASELMGMPEVPATVTINEAVELAKTFGTAESRKFVNGIVDRMARKLGRL